MQCFRFHLVESSIELWENNYTCVNLDLKLDPNVATSQPFDHRKEDYHIAKL